MEAVLGFHAPGWKCDVDAARETSDMSDLLMENVARYWDRLVDNRRADSCLSERACNATC